jgi:hypothetical protein
VARPDLTITMRPPVLFEPTDEPDSGTDQDRIVREESIPQLVSEEGP